MTQKHGAIVEIVEELRSGETLPPCLKPRAVRVNGVDVGLIKRDSIKINVGDQQNPAEITLTLLPSSVLMSTWTVSEDD